MPECTDIFMVVAKGQFAVLPVKTMFTAVILPRGTGAVPPPIPERNHDFPQQIIIGADSAALAHGHMVRRIKTDGG